MKYISFTAYEADERKKLVNEIRPWIEANCEWYEYNTMYPYISSEDNHFIVGVSLTDEDATMLGLTFKHIVQYSRDQKW